MDKKQYDVETLKLLKQYQKFKELLTVNIQYDIILKDNRIVLPTVFHRTAVKRAHVGHQGVQKTKALMRSKVFFIGMHKAIEDEINNLYSLSINSLAYTTSENSAISFT